MIEVVAFSELKKGDTIIFDGFSTGEVVICEIEDIDPINDRLVPKDYGGLDISPPNLDEIVRIGRGEKEPLLFLITQKLHLKLNDEWVENLETLNPLAYVDVVRQLELTDAYENGISISDLLEDELSKKLIK